MPCDKFQELILTDYLDNELNTKQRREIESHLAACPDCKEFAHKAKIAAVDPFEHLERIEPSLRLWQNINEAVKADLNVVTPRRPVDLWEKVKQWFPVPRQAFAVAVVFVMIVLVMTILTKQINQSDIAQMEAEEQIEYLAALVVETSNTDPDYNGGYGTAIEEYFL